MNNEKQQQAKGLYFQTDLTKTQIAELLGISRRSLHYWIRQNNWDRLKRAATHLPAMLAENCYMIINQFTTHLLSENRIMRPVTHLEAETLHKLTLSVKKLKNHSTLNESMEMFAHFMERINKKSPALAEQITPFVEEYVEDWAKINVHQFKPENFNDQGFIPIPASDSPEYQQQTAEFQKDIADISAWEDEQAYKAFQQRITHLDDTDTTTTPSPLGEGRGEASPAISKETLAYMREVEEFIKKQNEDFPPQPELSEDEADTPMNTRLRDAA